MAEKLRIQRKDIYEIEVNDNGDTICFELGDVELPFRLDKAYEGINDAQNWLKQRLTIINKQQDSKVKNSALTKNQKLTMEAQRECFRRMRQSIDLFLGEGGCQKVFGDTNYFEMFNDLFDALSQKGEDGLSHLDRMKISNDSIAERVMKKYDSVKDKVI